MGLERLSVGQRVAATRWRVFVGRQAEQELFRQAVEAPEGVEPPFTVLHVFGPGGIGKSALLYMFGEFARVAGARVVRFDGRERPDREAIRAAAKHGAGSGRTVLLLDSYELLAPLDGWLRHDLVPGLPGDSIVVLAGRAPPSPGWVDDPGWRELTRSLPLSGLAPAEAASLLAGVGFSDVDRDRVLAFAAGYPLVLTLAKELAGHTDAVAGQLVEPEVVGALMSRLVDAAPTALHRTALQVCALARVTTESLLRDCLGAQDAGAVFEWLRQRPYIESGERGLMPHDVVREVLVADLRWREPDLAETLRLAVRHSLIGRFHAVTEAERSSVLLDFMFGFWHDPITREFFDWDTFGAYIGQSVHDSDRDSLQRLLHDRLGLDGAAAMMGWLPTQRSGFEVHRTAGAVQAVVVFVTLHDADPAALRTDPVAGAAWQWARERGLGPDEEVTMIRLSVDRDADQRRSVAFDLASVRSVREVLTRPRLAFDFAVTTDPEYMRPLYDAIGYRRLPELDTTAGGVRYAVFVNEWRADVPELWADIVPPRTEASGPSEPDAAFADAVRTALRSVARADQIARSPLVGTVADSAEQLRAALIAEVERLRGHPRDAKLYRALDRTYLRPAPTQERAAELLGLPFSTYRRHLTQGVNRVVAGMWEASRN